MRLRHGLPLVGVDADAELTLVASGLDQSTVSGLAAGAEDDVRVLVYRLFGSGGTPLWIGEGDIQTTGMVSGDHFDIWIDVL
ncbi:MAG: hypothetical protein MUO67_06940, partial [Anaerolineales bacterium]|nr:hypothetical protein [Anaerolineales bacterium]